MPTSHRHRNIDLGGVQIGAAAEAQLQRARTQAGDYVMVGYCGAFRLGRVVKLYAMGDRVAIHVRGATAVNPGAWTLWGTSAPADAFLGATS
eukprot:7459723-Pyramimonas_sp.AAC.1